MASEFKIQKRLIVAGLGLLVAADLVLAVYSWRLSSASRMTPAELAHDLQQVKLQTAEVNRVELIRKDLPQTVKDCDKFEESLLPAGQAYSVISSELGELAKKSGLQVQGINLREKAIVGRNLSQVDMEMGVNGDYPSIVKFLNGVQRSKNTYVVDSVTLAADTSPGANGVRVVLHLRTYLRATA